MPPLEPEDEPPVSIMEAGWIAAAAFVIGLLALTILGWQ